jgi:hypothetical protein
LPPWHGAQLKQSARTILRLSSWLSLFNHLLNYLFGAGAGVAQSGYGLGDRDSIPGRGKDFFIRHRFKTDSEAHTTYQKGTGESLPAGKMDGA